MSSRQPFSQKSWITYFQFTSNHAHISLPGILGNVEMPLVELANHVGNCSFRVATRPSYCVLGAGGVAVFQTPVFGPSNQVAILETRLKWLGERRLPSGSVGWSSSDQIFGHTQKLCLGDGDHTSLFCLSCFSSACPEACLGVWKIFRIDTFL